MREAHTGIKPGKKWPVFFVGFFCVRGGWLLLWYQQIKLAGDPWKGSKWAQNGRPNGGRLPVSFCALLGETFWWVHKVKLAFEADFPQNVKQTPARPQNFHFKQKWKTFVSFQAWFLETILWVYSWQASPQNPKFWGQSFLFNFFFLILQDAPEPKLLL